MNEENLSSADAQYLLVWLYNNGLLILFWHQHTGGEGGLDHVDDQVIGEDIQFLYLVPCHVGAPRNAISARWNDKGLKAK